MIQSRYLINTFCYIILPFLYAHKIFCCQSEELVARMNQELERDSKNDSITVFTDLHPSYAAISS